MYFVYRVLCRVLFLRPKAVPFFKINPELEKMVEKLARNRGELLGWRLYGDPKEKGFARKEQDRHVLEMNEQGEELRKYLLPYIKFSEKYPDLYGKGEWHRWYLAATIKDHPRDYRVIPDNQLLEKTN